MKQINFDMDGTIADLYSVKNWLPDLIAESTRPYEQARPLVNFSRLARLLNTLQRNGYTIAVISWGSKNASEEYLNRIAEAKLAWLSKHLPSVTFDSIKVVAYGTPKSTCGNGILFDDEERNRNEWEGEAFSEKEIFSVLTSLKK